MNWLGELFYSSPSMADQIGVINSTIANAILFVTVLVALLPAFLAAFDFLRRREQSKWVDQIKEQITLEVDATEARLSADVDKRYFDFRSKIENDVGTEFGELIFKLAEEKAQNFVTNRDIAIIIQQDLKHSFITNEIAEESVKKRTIQKISEFEDVVARFAHSSNREFVDSLKRFDTRYGDNVGIHSSFLTACLVLVVDKRTGNKKAVDRLYVRKFVEKLCSNADIKAGDLQAYLEEQFGITNKGTS